jgi:hypothetical protein
MFKPRPVPILLLIGIFCLQSIGLADNLLIGSFSGLEPAQGLPAQWEKMIFPKIQRQTIYALIRDNQRTVVQAISKASASGLIRHFSGSAEQYPWIAWQWKIDHVLQKGDLSVKRGDDFAARIYVAFEFSPEGKSWWQRMQYKTANLAAGGKLPGTAINYIWANKAARGTLVSNPFTDQTKMIVLQSGNMLAGQWIAEKRNLLEDYRAAFGHNPPPITGIAIMTDTDNTGESTTAYYGDIQLSSD